MNEKEIIAAIFHIRPNAEFVLRGDDLEWLDANQDEPKKAEIEAGWLSYQAKIEADKANAEAKREAALAKLAALGLEPDDLKALGL